MKDPFKAPHEFTPSAVGKVAMKALVGDQPDDKLLLITTPARWPRDVDDARDDLARCLKCLGKVWIFSLVEGRARCGGAGGVRRMPDETAPGLTMETPVYPDLPAFMGFGRGGCHCA